MKRILLVILFCGILILPACAMEEEVKKDTVMVDTLKVTSAFVNELAVGGEFVEIGILADDELMQESETAFNNYLELPSYVKDDFVSTVFSPLEYIQNEMKPIDDELMEKIQSLYPQAVEQGYYEVTKNYTKAGLVVSGKFQGESNEVLEISNPFWEDAKVDRNLTVVEAEVLAGAYVAEKGLVGTETEFDLQETYRFSSSDQAADLFWFRYENRSQPTQQALVYMRADSTAILGFYRSYVALQMQAEVEKFAKRIE